MLLAVQFPFADTRAFLPAETRRVTHPDWKNPQAGKGFVRTFGGLQARLKGGISEWPNEEVVCQAYGAPKFVPPLYSRFSGDAGWTRGRCAFRRLLSNGRGMTRLELGFAVDHGFRKAPGNAILRAVEDVLSLDVRIPSDDGQDRQCKLSESGPILAKHYLTATTRTRPQDGFKPKPGWISAGEPLVFIELLDAQIDPPARTFRSVPLPAKDYKLFYARALHRGQYIGIWILNAASDSQLLLNQTFASADTSLPRSVRLHLMRLHAERQTLKLVLQQIDGNGIPVQARKQEGDPLQNFLNLATGLLLSKEVYGVPMPPMLQAIEAFDDLVTPGQRASLLAHLNDIRPNILKKIQTCTEATTTEGQGVIEILDNRGQITLQINRQEGKLVSQYVNAQNATIHGDFVVADLINNSFNRVKDSHIQTELKDNLDELNKAVNSMVQNLPADTARDAAKALDTVTQEATSEKPDEDYFTTGAKKLVKIAKGIGEAAGPVIEIANTVAKLLGFGGIS